VNLFPYLVPGGSGVVAFDSWDFGAPKRPPGLLQLQEQLRATSSNRQHGPRIDLRSPHDASGANAAASLRDEHTPIAVHSPCAFSLRSMPRRPPSISELRALRDDKSQEALTAAILQSPEHLPWCSSFQRMRSRRHLATTKPIDPFSVRASNNFSVKPTPTGLRISDPRDCSKTSRNTTRLPKMEAAGSSLQAHLGANGFPISIRVARGLPVH